MKDMFLEDFAKRLGELAKEMHDHYKDVPDVYTPEEFYKKIAYHKISATVHAINKDKFTCPPEPIINAFLFGIHHELSKIGKGQP